MAAFTAGDLVVYRVGTGTGPLVSTGNAVFLDEYSPAGALVQSIALPTAAAAGMQHALFASGTASSEGLLTLSADGQHLVLTGYSLMPGTNLPATTSAADPRTIGSVDYTGAVDTTTALTDFNSSNNPRSGTSVDGTSFYIDGGTGGVRYAVLGATTSTSVSTTTPNLRDISIFDGQLYVSSSSGALRIGSVGAGVSDAGGQMTTPLAGISGAAATPVNSPYQFFFTHLGPTGAAPDTLYIADDTTAGGEVEKFSLVSGAWVSNGALVDPAVRGLTGVANGSAVTLYTTTGGSAATGGGSLDTFTDTSGFNQTLNGALAHLAGAAANEAFRGVAFAPVTAAMVAPASLSVSNVSHAEGDSGATNFVFTITRSGDTTGAVTFNASTSDGSATAGSDYVAQSNVPLTIAAGATTASFAVVVNGDTVVEPDETFAVTLTGVVGATAPTADGMGVIQNDDVVAPGPIPSGTQTQTYAITAAGAYTLAAGQTFTETGLATAVTATDTDTAATSIDIEGALVGAAARKGVVETVPDGQLTVGAAGSIRTTDADAFQFVQPAGGGGHSSVTNLGSILSATTIGTPNTAGTGETGHGYGLNVNAATGAAGATDHTSGGTVVNGSITNATALIESDSDDAIRLGANQTLTNYGRIVGAGPVDDSASNNGLKQPVGSTSNTYDSSRGVEINKHSHDTVDNFGRIEGAQHGVDAGDVADSDITVVNEVGGVIIGHNGSGVGSDGATANAVSAGDVTVTNSGQIYGEYHPTYDRSGAATIDGDGDGVDIDGAGTVLNKAGAVIAGAGVDANGAPVLNGHGAGGYDSNGRLNHSEGLSLGGGVVDNFGTISGADYGVTVNNDGTANRSGVASTTITNEVGATITGQNGYAIRLENKGSDGVDTDVITNHGAITGGGAVPLAGGTAMIENNTADQNTVGMINGVAYQAGMGDTNRFVLGDGAAIQTGEGNDTLTNDGSVTGSDGRAISLEGGDDTLNLFAEGAVTGGIDGGAGVDTLNLQAHAAATARTLSGVTGFEALHVQSGVWSLSDTETYTGGATISAGASLQEGVGVAAGGVTGAVVDNGVLIIDRSDAVTLDATVSGAGVLQQTGAGATTLSAAHAFGGVTVAAGVLDVAVAGGAGAGAITFGASSATSATLRVEAVATAGGDFANVLTGFAAGDTLDVAGVGMGASASFNATSHVLTVAGSAGSETFHFDPGQSFAGQIFKATTDASGTGVDLALAADPAAPVTLFSADFANFTASGFAPGAAAASGQLDSNVWRVVGLSDNTNPGYGFTGPAGGDFGRGVILGSADPVSAGVYSPSANHALVLQPTNAELNTRGFIEAHIVNNTGSAANPPSLDFDWTFRNSGGKSNDLQLSYSTDDVKFTPVAAANFSTPGAADAAVAGTFSVQHEHVVLNGLNLAPGGDLFLRWTNVDVTGSGNSDEVGIDNVLLQSSPATPPATGTTVSIAADFAGAAEGDAGSTPFTFTLTRAGDLSAPATVDYTVTGSGASPANAGDFVGGALPHGTASFAAGAATASISIAVAGDTANEPNEGFSVSLANASGGASITGAAATELIRNDDTGPLGVYDIQGHGQTSPFAGQMVTTTGVVTAIDTSTTVGFYIQAPDGGDHDPSTSDALFVYTGATPTVTVGQAVTVTGTVNEFQPSASSTPNNLTVTELDPTSVTVTGTGHIDPVLIGDGGLAPPTGQIASDGLATYDPTKYAADFYESLEGQLVTVHNAQVVDNTFSGETFIVPDNGADSAAHMALNARGGVTITPGADAAHANYAPERIELFPDNGVLAGYAPAYNQGDHLGDVTGVLTYYNGNYELVPTVTPAVTTTQGPPVDDVTTLHSDANHLTVGAYNVDNLGPTSSVSTNADDTPAKYAALGHDIAVNLGGPAILGIEEIQDADGEGPGTDYSGTATLTQLTGAITAAGGPHYQFVEVAPTVNNANGGAPNGNIRSAFLYDASRVSLVAGSVRLIDDPNAPYTSANGTFHNSREPLAADFTFNGQTVTVIDVHDYSRGGSDELYGKDQPPFISGDDRRTAQADAVLHYVQGLEAANPNAQIVVEGDFNGFYFEKALTDLGQTNPATGQPTLVNLVTTLSPAERYSYNFEGDSEQLDNLLVTPNLAAGALFDDVHVNTGILNHAATDPNGVGAASDHDPILSQLTIGSSAVITPPAGGGGSAGGGVTLTGGSSGGQLTGSAGADSLTAGSAGDTLFGGDGADTLTTGSGRDVLFGNAGDDHIIVTAASQGVSVYAGQGADTIDASGSQHPNYLSGDRGDDLIVAGSGGDLVLGGDGADTLVSGGGHAQLFGNTGDDHIAVGAASQGVAAYGGQGDDVIDASRSNAPNYLSGDLGNDTIISGAGFETVLGGEGDDSLVGGASAGAGSMQLLLGNQGNDHLSYAGAGGVELFGGADSDTLSLTATGAGQVRYAFGNMGADTLTATGGADSLYGGQGDDVVSAASDTVGHNYLTGDIGDDVVTSSTGGFDTLRGGPGSDSITIKAHAAGAGDTVLVGAGESTSASAADETNLAHIIGFTSGSDHVVLTGHAALNVGAGGDLTVFSDGAQRSSQAAAFAAAYVYAFGDGASNAAHAGATEYLAVQESYGSTTATFLFTADHHAIAFIGNTAASLQTGDVVAG